MTQSRPRIHSIALLLLLAVPTVFVLAMVFGGVSMLLDFGRQMLQPKTYWSEQVDKSEARIRAMSREHDACNLKTIQSDSQLIEMYSNLVKQGKGSKEALELVLISRKAIKNSCNHHLDKMIIEATLLSNAQDELQKYSR
jgi:hypothetical protein